MKLKLSEMVQVTVLFHTDDFIFVWSVKTRSKTAPRGPKLGYYVGRVPKLSVTRVTLATSVAGVVCI